MTNHQAKLKVGGPWLKGLTGDQSGSVAVTTALCMTILVGMLAFVLDAGYLYSEKNRCQNAVEAAALAGAVSLCEGDAEAIEDLVRSVAEANGLSLENGALSVGFGFYDERNLHGDFPVYKDFVDETGMPGEEYINAVLVSYEEKAVLTGLLGEGAVAAAAVAYLRRLDMVSLEGEIRLGHDSTWNKCTFFSNGTIKYPTGTTMAGKSYAPPDFLDSLLLAVGGVFKCPVTITSLFPAGSQMTIHWDAGSSQSPGNSRTNLEPMEDIRPVDEGTLEYWRQRADIVYTPDQAGGDNVFYGAAADHYYVDLGGMQSSERRVIFFDAGENSSMTVLIGPVPTYAGIAHTPAGFAVSNVTFVATCSIHIQHANRNAYPELHLGTDGMEQVVIISAKDIELDTGGVVADGVVFRTGGDFLLRGGRDVKMRVIADGKIDGDIGGVTPRFHLGLVCDSCECVFGPPCPPVSPKLGRLANTD